MVQTRHGVFVENRLRHLLRSGRVEARVVAPVPWFPFTSPRFGRYAAFAGVGQCENRAGIPVEHPKYPVIPRVGMSLAPWLMARSAAATLGRIIREGYDFDLIDAHYFYPDGVAAAMLARKFGKPLVITARGSDLNVIPDYRLPRRMIQWAAGQASGMITVCQALKDVLVGLNVEPGRITVLRNGVDLDMFHPPRDREALRRQQGIHRTTLLSVGNLIRGKGHDLVIRALQELPGTELVIIGSGEEDAALRQLAASSGVADRVTFTGTLAHDRLAEYYGAADVLVLASRREGWANVLLESMACGTPVVATRVGGTPEVVAGKEAGVLMERRDVDSLVKSVRMLQENYPDRDTVRRYAERFGWDETTQGQLDLFSAILGKAA